MASTEATKRLQRAKRILAELAEIDVNGSDYEALAAKVHIVQVKAKSALAEMSKRGNPEIAKARNAAVDAQEKKYLTYHEEVRPVITAWMNEGHDSIQAIQEKLEASAIAPPRGGDWSYSKVYHLLQKLEIRPTRT
ncbi:MAG: hypothetical protein JJ979_02645 [Roseibium sp.]|nr:hypothetical protein [Roseibium sp.]